MPVRFRAARHTALCSCAPGTNLAWPAAKLLHLVAWKGKVFDPDKAELLNEVGPFGWKSVRAKVYKDESWLDGEQSIVLDYSGTSLVAHWIRDEIRLVAPGRTSGSCTGSARRSSTSRSSSELEAAVRSDHRGARPAG